MKNESDVKKAVKKILDALGFWWFMPVQTGYGRQGIPDFIVCARGRFVAIETKFGGNTLSAHQVLQQHKIIGSLGDYYVVDEKNIDALANDLASYRCE